jgi:hypothetical protein
VQQCSRRESELAVVRLCSVRDMNDARAAYIGHQPNQQIKTNVFLGRRAHTHFQISKQQFSASGPCERREKQLYSTREQQRRLFSLDSERERQQGNNTKPRAKLRAHKMLCLRCELSSRSICCRDETDFGPTIQLF